MHREHPARTADGEQQKPPRHVPPEHLADPDDLVHAPPTGISGGVAVRVGEGEVVGEKVEEGVMEGEAPGLIVGVLEGVTEGVAEGDGGTA